MTKVEASSIYSIPNSIISIHLWKVYILNIEKDIVCIYIETRARTHIHTHIHISDNSQGNSWKYSKERDTSAAYPRLIVSLVITRWLLLAPPLQSHYERTFVAFFVSSFPPLTIPHRPSYFVTPSSSFYRSWQRLSGFSPPFYNEKRFVDILIRI